MAVAPVNFGIQSNPGRFGHDGTGLLTNCYAESKGNEGKASIVIYATPGLKLFANEATATTGTRGLFPLGDSLYWVVDRQLRKVDTTGSHTFIGGVADNGKVSMARNTKANTPQIAIATLGGLRFVLEEDNLEPITDTDLPPPIDVEFNGGYILYLLPSGEVFYSEINDAANVDALNFFDAEQSPDGGKAIRLVGSYIYVFGDETIQPFQNTGGTDNPFTPILGGTIEIGCLAGPTVQTFKNTAIWVANDETVRILSGNSTQKVSNAYVDQLIREETSQDDLTGDYYALDGHDVYALSGTSFTVEYDLTTGLWRNRESSGMTRWRGQCITKFRDKWIVGDKDNGNLYELDSDTYDENGNDMTMAVRSPLIHNTPNRLQYNTLWLDFATGVGLNSTDVHNSNPQVTLRHSDNGGRDWSNQKTRTLGKIGEYKKRVKFNRLGTERFKGRTFEFRVSPKVARAFIGAHADLQEVIA